MLLFAALVGVEQLLTPPQGTLDRAVSDLLVIFSLLVTILGGLYVWDLRATLVASRGCAKRIIDPIPDPEDILADAKRDPTRHQFFPWAITIILYAGLGLIATHFGIPLWAAILVPVVLLFLTRWLGEVLGRKD